MVHCRKSGRFLAVGIWAFVDLIIIICGAFTDGDGYRITEWT